MSSWIDKNFRFLESVTVARETMQQIHSSNIANVDTPNYRADNRSFEEVLQLQKKGGKLLAAKTNPRHLTVSSSHSQPLSPQLSHGGINPRMDGNTVNLQQEMVSLSENQLMHEFAIRLLKGKISTLANVIKEGGR